MKKVFVTMIMGALLTGATAFAQNANTGATQKQTTQQCCTPGCNGKPGKKTPRYNAFEGVQVTPDQQQRLQVLQQGLGPVVLDKAQQQAIPENPNLTKEQKKQLKKERKAKKIEAKKNYLNGVKEILTPDQYVIFLENTYVYTPEPEWKNYGKSGHKKGQKDRKGHKEGKNKAGKAKTEKK